MDSGVEIYVKSVEKQPETDNREPFLVYAETLFDLISAIEQHDRTGHFDLYVDRQTYLLKRDLETLFENDSRITVHDPDKSEGLAGLKTVDFIAGAGGNRFRKKRPGEIDYYEKIRKHIINRSAKREPRWLIHRVTRLHRKATNVSKSDHIKVGNIRWRKR